MKKLRSCHGEIQIGLSSFIRILVIVQRLPFEGFFRVECVCEWEWG